MNITDAKREARKALKAAGHDISKSSTTAVRGFHEHSEGWDMWEFAGALHLSRVAKNVAATITEAEAEECAAILRAAGLDATVTFNLTHRVTVNF